MKKIVLAQVIILSLVVVAGVILKSDLASGVRVVHRLLGMLAGVMGIVVAVQAFMKNQSTTIKILSVVALLLTLSAAQAGMSISEATSNYNATFGRMALSGVGALIVSVISLITLKKVIKEKS